MKAAPFFLGLIFLFNPNIGIFDLLPDVVGYVLIFYSLSTPAMLQPTLSESRDTFRSLITVSAAKIGALILLFFMQRPSRSSFDSGWNLTLSFGFGLLELYFGFKAFSKLYDGLDTMLMRYGTPTEDEKHANALTMTYIFLVVKQALCVGAELPFLLQTKTTGVITMTDGLPIKSLHTVLTMLNLLAVTVLGIVWLSLSYTYLKRFKDQALSDRLLQAYREYLTEHPQLLHQRRLLTGCRMTRLGALFMINFTVWNINIIPDALFGVLCLSAFFLLSRGDAIGVPTLTLPRSLSVHGILFTGAALAQYIVSITFFALYHITDESQSYADVIYTVIGREHLGFVLLVALLILTVAQGILLTLFISRLRRMLIGAAHQYTTVQTTSEQLRGRNDEIISLITSRLNAAFAAACVLGASMIAQQLLLFTFGLMWFITFCCSIAFATLMSRALDTIADAAEGRLLYE